MVTSRAWLREMPGLSGYAENRVEAISGITGVLGLIVGALIMVNDGTFREVMAGIMGTFIIVSTGIFVLIFMS